MSERAEIIDLGEERAKRRSTLEPPKLEIVRNDNASASGISLVNLDQQL